MSAPSQHPDVFAKIQSLLTPEAVLGDPRATGAGIAVAVLDSGIEESLLRSKFRGRGEEILPIRGAIFEPDRAEPAPYDGRQSSPHGTTVADIILTLAPRVQLYSANIFGSAGSCAVDVLLRALHHAVDVWKCKIVNLSLGIAEQRLQQVPRRYQFLRAVEDAYYKDVMVFAAADNDHPLTHSYPAVFAPPLFSVDKGEFADALRFAYRLREQVEFQAQGRGYLGPFANEPATSWAAPHLAGIAARILSLRPGLKPFEMKTILYWLSKHG